MNLISKILPEMSSLEELNIEDNKLTYRFVSEFVQKVGFLPSLRRLNVTRN